MLGTSKRIAAAAAVLLATAAASGSARAYVDAPAAESAADNYKCYAIGSAPLARTVTLADRFERRRVTTAGLNRLCNPVQVLEDGMRERRAHLTCYAIRSARGQPAFLPRRVQVRHRFGSHLLTLRGIQRLCSASLKEIGPATPTGAAATTLLDSLKCYRATPSAGFSPFPVTLTDQFGEWVTRVVRVESFCTPVQIGAARSGQDGTSLVCFSTTDTSSRALPSVTVKNGFGIRTVSTGKAEAFCLVSRVISNKPPPSSPPQCTGISIAHGKKGTLQITGPVVSSTLLAAASGPSYRIDKLGARSYRFTSRKEDGPHRVERLFPRVGVTYIDRGLRNTTVTCSVAVTHTAPPDPPPPPRTKSCIEVAEFRLDPAKVPKTGFTNFGASISFPGNAFLITPDLKETATLIGPSPDVFAPSHGWDALINHYPPPPPGGRSLVDYFVNTYWTNGSVPSTPLKPVWRWDVVYSVPAGQPCSARVEFVHENPNP